MMKEIKTTNEARKYFEDCGLSYASVNRKNFEELRILVEEELQKVSGNAIDMKLNPMKLKREQPCFVSIGKIEGIQYGYLTVRGSYFDNREAISFNSDGFIGFAGWSDSTNVKPFIKAFIRWCDKVKGEPLPYKGRNS